MKKTLFLFFLGFIIVSCNQTPKSTYINFGGFTQGTTYSITYESSDNINYKEEVEILLANFDSSLSTYNEFSMISQINYNKSNITDNYLRIVFEKANEIYKQSNNAFDLTVAPLVNAWGFGFKNKEIITDAKIDSILKFVGFNKVYIKDSIIIKSDPRIMLDVNAIAQGYSVDIVAEFIEAKGVSNYLVEIGGEVKANGINKKGKTWKIGIDKPFDNNNIPGQELQAIVKLSNKSLATSGNYRKFYERNGVKYSHTINPKTGYPVTHSLLSTTVIANDCMTADAYATAFMVMGFEEAYILAEKLTDIEALFVYNDENGEYLVKTTTAMSKLLEDIK
ncbi:MAG: FAD:protein FMN transferase [Bacteroidales bacterium]|jgi:thiamine biosynthesis lipoprotein|nr:FAD:protein FMN transferase [Bacteroidales bacterium]